MDRFQINEYLALELDEDTTYIYVKDKDDDWRSFKQCKYLLLNIPVDDISSFDEIDSVDDAEERLARALEVVNTQYCDNWEEPVLEVILPELERLGAEIERLRDKYEYPCKRCAAWCSNEYPFFCEECFREKFTQPE